MRRSSDIPQQQPKSAKVLRANSEMWRSRLPEISSAWSVLWLKAKAKASFLPGLGAEGDEDLIILLALRLFLLLARRNLLLRFRWEFSVSQPMSRVSNMNPRTQPVRSLQRSSDGPLPQAAGPPNLGVMSPHARPIKITPASGMKGPIPGPTSNRFTNYPTVTRPVVFAASAWRPRRTRIRSVPPSRHRGKQHVCGLGL